MRTSNNPKDFLNVKTIAEKQVVNLKNKLGATKTHTHSRAELQRGLLFIGAHCVCMGRCNGIQQRNKHKRLCTNFC